MYISCLVVPNKHLFGCFHLLSTIHTKATTHGYLFYMSLQFPLLVCHLFHVLDPTLKISWSLKLLARQGYVYVHIKCLRRFLSVKQYKLDQFIILEPHSLQLFHFYFSNFVTKTNKHITWQRTILQVQVQVQHIIFGRYVISCFLSLIHIVSVTFRLGVTFNRSNFLR